jgi:glycosyltransferase involved in cell wall biosynthesis
MEAGHSVRIYAWDRDCRYPESEESDGIRIERIEVRGAYGKFLPLLPGFLMFFLRLMVRSMKDGSDVIHCHDMDTLVPGVIVSRLTGRALVYDMHESYPDFISTFAPEILVTVLRFVEPFLIRRVGLVITTSSMIGDIARRAGAKNVVPVMNCFDPFPPPGEIAEEIRESICGGNEFLVLYIGGFFAARGLEEVIQAVSSLDGVKLFMGGYGPIEEDLKNLARETGASDRIIFGGEINPAVVPDYDAAADLLFAMYKGTDPNNILTIPNKFFESIAAAKPIMVSDLGEKSRLVSEVGNGVAVDPGDVGAVAEAIAMLRDDEDLYERMRNASREAQSRFTWGAMAGRLVESYSELLS